MTAVRIVNPQVKQSWRNCGYSWGLAYPLIYGRLAGTGCCVWNRHTGEITYVSQLKPNAHGYEFGMDDCRARSMPDDCRNFNNFDLDSVP